MRYILNIDGIDASIMEFQTQEQWKEHEEFLKRHGLQPYWTNEPDKYPCLCIDAGESTNNNGRDYKHYAFFYDYAKESE